MYRVLLHYNVHVQCLADLPSIPVQALLFGALAATTLRMKYLWTPLVCVLASTLVCDQQLLSSLLSKLRYFSEFKVTTCGSYFV